MDARTNTNVLQKECTYENGNLIIEFTHNDTVNKTPGKYYWDIKIYKDAEFLEGKLINGTEIDSYYAAYRLPICEIRQTGDAYLADSDQEQIDNNTINFVSAALAQVNALNTQLESALDKIPQYLPPYSIIQTANSSIPQFDLSGSYQRLVFQGKYQLIDANGNVIDTFLTGTNVTNTDIVVSYMGSVLMIPSYTKPAFANDDFSSIYYIVWDTTKSSSEKVSIITPDKKTDTKYLIGVWDVNTKKGWINGNYINTIEG